MVTREEFEEAERIREKYFEENRVVFEAKTIEANKKIVGKCYKHKPEPNYRVGEYVRITGLTPNGLYLLYQRMYFTEHSQPLESFYLLRIDKQDNMDYRYFRDDRGDWQEIPEAEYDEKYLEWLKRITERTGT